MRRLFQDPRLEEEFRKIGYVIVPFLDEGEVAQLKTVYFDLMPQNKGHITPDEEGHKTGEELSYDFTFINRNINYKRACFDAIVKVFQPKSDKLLDHYQPLIANFIRKEQGDGEVPLHQNWAFAYERKCTTVTIWSPLVNSNKANGALQIIPGSHKKFGEVRGPMIPWELQETERNIIKSDYWDYMEIPAGHAVILDDSILHYSAPNRTEDLRLAIQLILLPEEIPSIHYHLNPEKDENLVQVLKVDREFYMNFNPWKKPSEDIEIIDSFHFEPVSLSFKEFEARLMEPPFDLEGEAYDFRPFKPGKKAVKPLFKDPELAKEFSENGFIHLPSILDEHAVQTLKSFYEEQNLRDEKGYGFHISMDQSDKDRVTAIMDKVYAVALPQVAKHFVNPKPYICSYVVKEPNPLGLVPSHQDWTFVDDEDAHCSATMWIPLVDVGLDNGACGAIRGSHKFLKNHRPSPSPGVKNPLDPYMFQIFPYHEIIEMKAGDGFVFDIRTFHASPPNTSRNTRLAIGLGFTQNEAKLVHYYLDPKSKDKLHKYEVDEDFFKRYDNATLTRLFESGELIRDYPSLGTYPYRPPRFDPDWLLAQIKANGNEFNAALTVKLAKLYQYNPDGSKKETDERQETTFSDTFDKRQSGLPFWKVYTPSNIVREIAHRVGLYGNPSKKKSPGY